MAAMYWGVIKEPNEYHRVRPKYGDSTDPSALTDPLPAELWFGCSFCAGGQCREAESSDRPWPSRSRWLPAPRHRRHAPSGGGHYILAIGYTDTHLIAHDPYGELDVVNGGYPKPVEPMAKRFITPGRTGRPVGAWRMIMTDGALTSGRQVPPLPLLALLSRRLPPAPPRSGPKDSNSSSTSRLSAEHLHLPGWCAHLLLWPHRPRGSDGPDLHHESVRGAPTRRPQPL